MEQADSLDREMLLVIRQAIVGAIETNTLSRFASRAFGRVARGLKPIFALRFRLTKALRDEAVYVVEVRSARYRQTAKPPEHWPAVLPQQQNAITRRGYFAVVLVVPKHGDSRRGSPRPALLRLVLGSRSRDDINRR